MAAKLPTLDEINLKVGDDKLTALQYEFCKKYRANGGNGMSAIRDAGFNHSTPGSQSSAAHRLLKKIKVKRALKVLEALSK